MDKIVPMRLKTPIDQSINMDTVPMSEIFSSGTFNNSHTNKQTNENVTVGGEMLN